LSGPADSGASAEGRSGLTPGPRLPATGTERGGQVRRQVLLAVQAYPGLTIREIAGAVGLYPGGALYHVRKLATLGRVVLERRNFALQVYPVLIAVTHPLPMSAITGVGSRRGEPPARDLRGLADVTPSRPGASEAASP